MLTPQQYAEAYYAARGQSVQLLPFFYCTSVDLLQPGPIFTLLPIDRDSDFVLCDVRAVVSRKVRFQLLNALQTSGRDQLLIEIGRTGRTLTDAPNDSGDAVNIVDLSGWADRPFVFFEPVILAARTVLSLAVIPDQRVPRVVVKTLDLAFGGMKAIPGLP